MDNEVLMFIFLILSSLIWYSTFKNAMESKFQLNKTIKKIHEFIGRVELDIEEQYILNEILDGDK